MAETVSDLRKRVLATEASTSYGDLGLQENVSSKNDLILHDGLAFSQFMLAGSVAGIVEHVAIFPIDTLKTRVQMACGPAPCGRNSGAGPCGSVHSLSRIFFNLMKAEGPSGLYRGLGAMVLGAGPSHAVYFAFYEVCKEKYGGNKEGHQPLAHMAAGASATVASDAVLTPMDVVKQRLQLRESPYRSVTDCVKRMLREEGFRAFYASYRTTVLMNVPFTGVHFATYEAAKKIFDGFYPYLAEEEHLLTHLIAGGMAGGLASAITTPLDVVKTRLQCQGVCGSKRFETSSIREVIQQIVKQEGPWALFKGLKPRVMFHVPAAAISWSTYEAGKAFLQRWNTRKTTSL